MSLTKRTGMPKAVMATSAIEGFSGIVPLGAAAHPHSGFQSAEALDAVEDAKKVNVVEDPVSQMPAPPPVVRGVVVEDPMKPVRVKVREHIKNMRVGPNTYNLTAGQDTIVPVSVARHLKERNLLVEERKA